MSAGPGIRSRKTLACTAEATAFQKAFGQELKRMVVDEGAPFVIAQADTPHEIFHAMDIPVIANQWWSAYISAKQLSARYFDAMVEAGYPENSLQVLLARARLHAGQRSGDRAVGRPANADRARRPADLRLHPARLRPVGEGHGHRLLRDGSAGLGAQGGRLVRALEQRSGKRSTRKTGSP